jgi:hypothetical protein
VSIKNIYLSTRRAAASIKNNHKREAMTENLPDEAVRAAAAAIDAEPGFNTHEMALRALQAVLTATDAPALLAELEKAHERAAATLPYRPDETLPDEAMQRLGRAAFQVDSTHHFHVGPDGLPVCSCGFVGDARKRTQTEHITAAVLDAFDHD